MVSHGLQVVQDFVHPQYRCIVVCYLHKLGKMEDLAIPVHRFKCFPPHCGAACVNHLEGGLIEDTSGFVAGPQEARSKGHLGILAQTAAWVHKSVGHPGTAAQPCIPFQKAPQEQHADPRNGCNFLLVILQWSFLSTSSHFDLKPVVIWGRFISSRWARSDA